MKNFTSGGGFRKERKGGFAGRPSFGNNRPAGKFGGRGDRNEGGDRGGEMFTTNCTKCGKSCEVPFRPSGDRPVLCRECYVRKDDESVRVERKGDSFGRDSRPAPRFDRPQAPYQAPVVHDTGMADVKRQLAAMESKLNRILDLINPPLPREEQPGYTAPAVKKPRKEKVVKEMEEVVTEKKPKKKVAKKAAK